MRRRNTQAPVPLVLLDRLRRRPAAGHDHDLQPDDVFLVSYPRSGNTWMRFLLANALYDEPTTFVTIERRIPDIYLNSRRELRRLPTPRVLKSHSWFRPDYRRVVYIVRDPRDVLVSYYHYARKTWHIADDMPIAGFAQNFVRGNWDVFGSWREHVGGWLGARRGDEDFLVVRYEDLIASPEKHLRRILTALDRPVSEERLARSVDLSSAGRMRELELREGKRWRGVNRTRRDIPFVGKARPGGGLSEVPAEAVQLIERAWKEPMERLGYDVPSTEIGRP